MGKIILNFLKSFIANLRMILFALILAIISWFAISFQLFPNITKSMDINITSAPTAYMLDDHLALAEDFNGTLTLQIQGKRYEVDKLSADDFEAYLDFSKVDGPGVYNADVIFKQINGEKCDVTNQSEVRTVNIIQNVQAQFTIVPNIKSVSAIEEMQINYENIEVNPKTVTVWGEKTLVASIDRAEVAVIGGEEVLSASADLDGELIVYSKSGNAMSLSYLNVETRKYTVSVPVFKQKELALDVTIGLPPNSNFDVNSLYGRMKINPEAITIASPDSSIDAYEKWSVGVIPLNELTIKDIQDGCAIPIELSEYTEYANLSGIDVARITFDDVDDYWHKTFEISSENFISSNAPAGYNFDYITKQISVKVVGPGEFIQEMTADDIIATINFGGITDVSEGVRAVGATFRISGSKVPAWVVDDYKINVNVTRKGEYG